MRDRRAQLVTIYGDPGVGKSRLAREFVAGLEGSTILAGRCLPYGEGITYWPLAEMVKAAAGIADDDPTAEALEKLRDCCGDDAVADLLGLASGVLDAVAGDRSAQEIAWAAHEWATELADAQPLVLVFEDIHWAEEPLLDLIEHLAERIRDVPVLFALPRTARAVRPAARVGRRTAAGGRDRARAAASRGERAARRRPARRRLDSRRAARRRAGEDRGQPALPRGDRADARRARRRRSDGRIPDTVQALIAARIDRLPRAREGAAAARRR